MTVGNVRQWLDQSDIDYFTHFVKAWIPFNAWFRDAYGTSMTERDILERVKTDGNRMRSRVIAQLRASGADSERLRNQIAGLHRSLAADPLEDRQQRRIALENVCIGRNPKAVAEASAYGRNYRVRRLSSPDMRFLCELADRRGKVVVSFTRDEPWDSDSLAGVPEFQELSPRQQTTLLACYKEVNPFLFRSLLADSSEPNPIMMDDYRFINDRGAIFAGLIDVLYEMRNLLFHGELVPDPRANDTFQPGYHLLRHFLRTIS